MIINTSMNAVPTRQSQPNFGAVKAFSKVNLSINKEAHRGYMGFNGEDTFIKPKIGQGKTVSILKKLDDQLDKSFFMKNILNAHEGQPLVKMGIAALELGKNEKKNPVLTLTSRAMPYSSDINEEIVFEQTSKGNTKADKLFESVIKKYNEKLKS